MKTFWYSFWSPRAALGVWECHAPWWEAGFDLRSPLSGEREERVNIVGTIQAENEGEVWRFVRACFGRVPEGFQARFCEERPDGWEPFTARFPRAGWMHWPIQADAALALRARPPVRS